MAENLKETLERMAQEWRQKAEVNGFSVDLEDPNDTTSVEEAYMLGRYDQTLSVMDELKVESELLYTV